MEPWHLGVQGSGVAGALIVLIGPGCLGVQCSEVVASLLEHSASSASIGSGMSSEKYKYVCLYKKCFYNLKLDTLA